MVGVAGVVGVELPVAVDELPLVAQDLHRLAHQALQVVADRLVEVVLECFAPFGQGAEDDAPEALDPQLAEAVPRRIEVPGEAALPLDAPPERNAHEVAGEVVAPVVIDAGVVPGIAELLAAHDRAAMGAAVDEGVQSALPVPADDHRRIAHVHAFEIPRFGDLGLEAQVVPGGPPEDAELLFVVEPAIVIDAEGYAGEVVARPDVFRFVPHPGLPLRPGRRRRSWRSPGPVPPPSNRMPVSWERRLVPSTAGPSARAGPQSPGLAG